MLARLICLLFGHRAQVHYRFNMVALRYPDGHPNSHLGWLRFEVCERCGELACAKAPEP